MDNMSLADIAAVTRNNDGYGDCGFGGGGWFMWIFALLLLPLMTGGGLWGNRGANGEPVTEAGLCNAMNFNNLENAVGRLNDNQAAIARQTDNGICQIGFQALQNTNAIQRDLSAGFAQQAQCCCDTLRAIDGVNYNGAMNTAAINANTTAGIQKILDTLCGNRMADMQNQINQLQLQSALCGVVRYPTTATFATHCNPFFNNFGFGQFGGNCGCGCNGNI